MASDQDYKMIKLDRIGVEKNVGLITLYRPQAYNAICGQLLDELLHCLNALDSDSSIGAIVITGSEKCFAAGADIMEMHGKTFTEMYSGAVLANCTEISKIQIPIIAAVNGICFGGGCELAMMCDIIYAGENAQFAQPEVNVGIVPGAGGTQRWSKTVGKSLAMEICLTGSKISAHEAKEAGLVSKVFPVENLLEEAIKLGEKVARKSPVIVRMIKEAVNVSYETSLQEGLRFERKKISAHEAKEAGLVSKFAVMKQLLLLFHLLGLVSGGGTLQELIGFHEIDNATDFVQYVPPVVYVPPSVLKLYGLQEGYGPSFDGTKPTREHLIAAIRVAADQVVEQFNDAVIPEGPTAGTVIKAFWDKLENETAVKEYVQWAIAHSLNLLFAAGSTSRPVIDETAKKLITIALGKCLCPLSPFLTQLFPTLCVNRQEEEKCATILGTSEAAAEAFLGKLAGFRKYWENLLQMLALDQIYWNDLAAAASSYEFKEHFKGAGELVPEFRNITVAYFALIKTEMDGFVSPN